MRDSRHYLRKNPGCRGACHRAGHFGPDPLAHPGYVCRMTAKVCIVIGLALLTGGTALLAQGDQLRTALDSLVAAYPDALAGHDDKVLRWRDGTVMPVSDGIE